MHHTHWCHFWENLPLSLYWLYHDFKFIWKKIGLFCGLLVFPYFSSLVNRWQTHTKLLVSSQCFKAGQLIKMPNSSFLTQNHKVWRTLTGDFHIKQNVGKLFGNYETMLAVWINIIIIGWQIHDLRLICFHSQRWSFPFWSCAVWLGFHRKSVISQGYWFAQFKA